MLLSALNATLLAIYKLSPNTCARQSIKSNRSLCVVQNLKDTSKAQNGLKKRVNVQILI